MEKKQYIQPEYEILLLEKVNIITQSGDPWEHEIGGFGSSNSMEGTQESGLDLSDGDPYTYGGW